MYVIRAMIPNGAYLYYGKNEYGNIQWLPLEQAIMFSSINEPLNILLSDEFTKPVTSPDGSSTKPKMIPWDGEINVDISLVTFTRLGGRKYNNGIVMEEEL